MIARAKQAFEHNSGLKAAFEAIRLIALAGSAHHALKCAEAQHLSPMVVGTLKAAAPAITTSAGDALTGPTMWPAVQAALRQASVFDAIAAEAMPVPFLMKVGMFTSTFTGAKIAEGAFKPAQLPLVAQNTLAPEKIVSLAVCTKEFLEGAPGSFESFAAQLQAAAVTASDAEFLTDIAATNNDVSSGVGTTSLADIQTDILLTLLPQVNYGPASSLFLVVGRDHARAMTMACMAAGISTMGFLGGVFGGLLTIVTDSLPVNTISIIDATGLVVATTPITVRSSDQATLELATSSSMASGPSVTASGSLVSLFQTHSVGILVERSMAFAPLRPNAYAPAYRALAGVPQ